jgi:hypothetical protein
MANLWKISLTLRAPFLLIVFFFYAHAYAQLCSDPSNVIYGLHNNGYIYPINVNTGTVGSAINPAYSGNAPHLSNALAYNQVNGKFYYFKRLPSSSPTEFVCFDPATSSYTILSSPATTWPVYVGAITNDGTGYYCWDYNGRFYYYKISTNTWTTISSNIKDQYGKDVDSIIRANPSGDAAIDGAGNLWILPSSFTQYGLFRLNAPLPTSFAISLTVQEVVPMTAPPSQFGGMALTPTGEIFLSTWDNAIYRLENDRSLTFMSVMSMDMADLTSCGYPMAVLASTDIRFTATVDDETVKLSWTRLHGSFVYVVERSTDNSTWKHISQGRDLKFTSHKILFIDASPNKGINFYRVKMVEASNVIKYSAVRLVDINNTHVLQIWPNPVSYELFIQNSGVFSSLVIYDLIGNTVKSVRITYGINKINLTGLPSGKYFVSLSTPDRRRKAYRIIKK